MRYFLTTNARRRPVVAGRVLEFEPVSLRGGTWLGVLAVDDEFAVSIAADTPGGVDEITFERYDGLKKNFSASTPPSPPPTQLNPEVRIAEAAAGSGIGRTTSEAPSAGTPVVQSVDLQMTANNPPPEPLLSHPVRRGKWGVQNK